MSITKCRQEESKYPDLKALIAERGLSSIPWQMTSWMTKNGLRPKHLPPMIASSSGPTIASTPPLQVGMPFFKAPNTLTETFPRSHEILQQAHKPGGPSLCRARSSTEMVYQSPKSPVRQLPSPPFGEQITTASSEMGYLRLGSDPYVNPNSPRGKSPRRSRRFDFGSESCLADGKLKNGEKF